MGRIFKKFLRSASFLGLVFLFSFQIRSLIAGDSNPSLDWTTLEGLGESVREIALNSGSDELAQAIRRSGAKPEALAQFREEAKKLGGKKFQVPLPFSSDEMKGVNERLSRSGLDFIEVVAGSEPIVPPSHILPDDAAALRHWLRVRAIVAPAAALVTAVTVGLILIRTGTVQASGVSAIDSASGFSGLLAPFVGAGLGGVGLKLVEHQVLYPYHSRAGVMTYRPFSLWGRFVVRDLAFAFIVNSLGRFISTFPTVAIQWPSSDWSTLIATSFEAAALSFGSVGLLELAFERLRSRGLVDHIRSVKYETWSMVVSLAGVTAFLTSPSWQYGFGAVAGYILTVSAPLWYKLLAGDRIYDWYSKKTLSGESSAMSSVTRVCVRALGSLSAIYSFRKKVR